MSLYPSLEDMVVDQEARAEVTAAITDAIAAAPTPYRAIMTSSDGSSSSLYSGLGLEEMMSFAGLDISEGALATYMPADLAIEIAHPHQPLVAVTAPADQGIMRAHVKQGIRPITLAKDQQGLIGIAVQSIDKGLFVSFVWQNSAAALGGMRFGDQILQIDGESVAGWSNSKALKVLKNTNPAQIKFAVRDRPFERTVTVQKDSQNQIGFVFKKGEINAIVKDSSAARNGLLINHNLVEVNGQNVVGMKDQQILQILKDSPPTVTLTIMPAFMYQHLIKKIGYSKIQKYMDHSIPEL